MRSFAVKQLWARKRRAIGASIAVVLGIAFLTATLVLGNAMTRGIDSLFTEGYSGTDVQVRNATDLGGDSFQIAAIDASIADVLVTVPGVEQVLPTAEGTAQITGSDGKPIGGSGPPTIGSTWHEFDRQPYVITDGRPPAGPTEVVIDTGTADAGDLAVGDTTTIRTPEPNRMTVVGLAELKSGSEMGGVTFAWFDLETAQHLMLGSTAEVTTVDVTVTEGATPDVVRDAVAAAIPAGTEALTGAELADEALDDANSDFLGFFRSFLLAFAVIALLVAAFSINNTFSILVAQRTRESALLRALGASRRQVLASVTLEALLIGVVASAIGLGTGLGLAVGLDALMTAAGFGIPTAGLGATSSVVAIAMATGVTVTLAAAIVPAARASRVAPLAALRDVAVDRSGGSIVRATIGVIFAVAGIVGLAGATEIGDSPMRAAGVGALCAFVGVILLGPVASRLAAGVIGTPVAMVRGTTGQLARRNAMRNPKRTAGTASALMIGTAVVALFASLGSSIKYSFTELLDQSFGGDLVIRQDGFSGAGLPLALSDEIAALSEVAVVAPLRDAPVLVGGDSEEWLVGSDLASMVEVADVGDVTGDISTIGRDQLAVSTRWAEDNGVGIGSAIDVRFRDGDLGSLDVVATYTEETLMGPLLVDVSTIDAHATRPSDFIVLVDLTDGVSLDDGRAAVESITARYGDPLVETSDEYLDSQAAQLDQMLGIVYALLGLAVVIAVIGIGNTLSLSLHERTRELGLLRAVGQSRRALRATVRWESVIIAVFGTVGGLALGTLVCWGLVRAISESEGFGSFAPSYPTLGIILGVAIISGVVAAARPARRAARLDVLDAIATD